MLYREPVGAAPCKQACPAGVDVPRYLRLISQGKFNESLAVVRERIPFPSVCGHVCPAPCETKCRAGDLERPVMIRALKRFVAERDTGDWKAAQKLGKSTGKRIAIVGSGPAGLTAAYYLAKLGHAVTVYEAQSKPGGMLRFGIPKYHLPEDILDKEIDTILELGVEFKLNNRVDKVDTLTNNYDAIFLAPGLTEGRKLSMPGADLKGMLIGIQFLNDISTGKKARIGKKVVVLGGGGVACDVARSALRLGASEVSLACLESRKTMPALPSEIDTAEKEGVKILPSRCFTQITGNGHVTGVKCLNLRWMKFDDEGRLHMETIPGSEHTIEADTVIFAVGQGVDLGLISDVNEIDVTGRLTISVDAETMATGRKGVFAGGDAVSGPLSVIAAINTGRKAAISIDKYLGGSRAIDDILTTPEEEVATIKPPLPVGQRATIPTLPVEERLSDFAEVELPLNEKTAIEQASRCLRCDLPIIADSTKCAGCRTCELRCSLRAEGTFNPLKARIQIRRLVKAENEYRISFTEECDTCGICARYCPYEALSREKRKIEVS